MLSSCLFSGEATGAMESAMPPPFLRPGQRRDLSRRGAVAPFVVPPVPGAGCAVRVRRRRDAFRPRCAWGCSARIARHGKTLPGRQPRRPAAPSRGRGGAVFRYRSFYGTWVVFHFARSAGRRGLQGVVPRKSRGAEKRYAATASAPGGGVGAGAVRRYFDTAISTVHGFVFHFARSTGRRGPHGVVPRKSRGTEKRHPVGYCFCGRKSATRRFAASS